MSDNRRLVALFVAVMGLGVAAFGVVRGLAATGPARGTRMIVGIAPPIDTAVVGFTQQAARDRLEEKADATRVVAAGDQLGVEIAEQDPQIVAGEVALLERTAHVEIASGPATVDARSLRRIDLVEQGVAIEAAAPVPFTIGQPITFSIDGKVRFTASPDHVDGAAFHVPMPSVEQAMDLRSLLVAGAAHAMHVLRREPFSRATGFVPRAWPFLAAGAVLLAAAALAGRKQR